MSTIRRVLCLLLAVSLAWVVPARAEPAEIASLRAKAEKGNAIAQYNLGLAYAEGRDELPVDLTQAFVWLSLSGDSGSTRKALESVNNKLTPGQLAEGRRLLAVYRATLPASNPAPATNHPSAPKVAAPAVPRPEPPAPDAKPPAATNSSLTSQAAASDPGEIAGLRNDKRQLSEELALAWKENDKLKASLTAAQKVGARDQQLGELVARRGQELASAQVELAQARARLDELTETAGKLQDEVAAKAASAAAAETARAIASETAVNQSREIATLNQKLATASQAAKEASGTTGRAASAQLAALQAQVADLKSQLVTAESARAALAAEQTQAASQVSKLSADLETARKESDHAQALAASAAAETARRASEREDPTAESLRGQLTAKQTVNTGLTAELEKVRHELADVRQKFTASEAARASAVEISHRAESAEKVSAGEAAPRSPRNRPRPPTR